MSLGWHEIRKYAAALGLVLIAYIIRRMTPLEIGRPLAFLAAQVICATFLGPGPTIFAAIGGLIGLLILPSQMIFIEKLFTMISPYLAISSLVVAFAFRRRGWVERLAKSNAEMARIIAEQTEALRNRNIELEKLSQALVEAEMHERERLRKLLHDDAQQILMAGKIKAELAERQHGLEAGEFSRYMVDAIQALRGVTRWLGPAWVTEDMGLDRGLMTMIRDFADQFHLKVTLNCPEGDLQDCGLDHPRCVTLLDVVRESLMNIVKHAGSSPAVIEAICKEDRIILKISDQGPGLPEGWEKSGTGMGLTAARQRVEALGGNFSIGPGPARGVTVQVMMPFQPDKNSGVGKM